MKTMKFEDALNKMEELSGIMEKPETTLDESLKCFNEGVELAKQCVMALNESKGKIVEIKKEYDKIVEEDLKNDL